MRSTIFEENVILKTDPTNPDNSTVRVLGGAGSYSLKMLKLKARKEALQLARDLEAQTDDAYKAAAYNIRQLKNTLDTVAAAIEQLRTNENE